jgi:hypothetical protein
MPYYISKLSCKEPDRKHLFCFVLFICAYNVWVISPPCPHPLLYHLLSPSLSLSPPQYPAETTLPLSLILLKENTSNNRKEQGFLLVEIRIAIQGIDSH